ncbi:MAG: hypothetical protein V2A34_15095, partial [Lentisphaerota bacterium]
MTTHLPDKDLRTMRLFVLLAAGGILMLLGFCAGLGAYHLYLYRARSLQDHVPAVPPTVQKTYDDIYQYIGQKVDDAAKARRTYWRDFFNSKTNYDEAIQSYRRDFANVLDVPFDCKCTGMPSLVSDEFVAATNSIDIHRWTLRVCDGQLSLIALVAIPTNRQLPLPLIYAFHGSMGSPDILLGLDPRDDYHHRFAIRLAEMGYMVFVPYLVTQEGGDNVNRLRNELDNRGRPVGIRLVGVELGES